MPALRKPVVRQRWRRLGDRRRESQARTIGAQALDDRQHVEGVGVEQGIRAGGDSVPNVVLHRATVRASSSERIDSTDGGESLQAAGAAGGCFMLVRLSRKKNDKDFAVDQSRIPSGGA